LILVGDIGGTKTRLAWVDAQPSGCFHIAEERRFASGEYTNFEHMLHEFLAAAKRDFRRACFGIAGPIQRQRCAATNLPWVVDAQVLSRSLNGAEVTLINDLEAVAHGIAAISPTDFEVLQPGEPHASGNACVVAAGTGLGEAGMYWDGRRHHPFATEGGHSSFSPANAVQVELLRYLQRQFTHVSWERVLSGPGLINLYHFFRDTRGGEEPKWLTDEMRTGDAAAAISRAAMEGKSELCEQALDLFVTLLGQEAGNAALRHLARGGVYLAGGIAPKILPRLRGPHFLGAFVAKGRMRALLEAMPVRVVLNDHAALLGAAVFLSENNPTS
jgi:glucokinase